VLHPVADQICTYSMQIVRRLSAEQLYESADTSQWCCSLGAGVELLDDALDAAAPLPPPGPVQWAVHLLKTFTAVALSSYITRAVSLLTLWTCQFHLYETTSTFKSDGYHKWGWMCLCVSIGSGSRI
jgi:hypothetical protein